MEEIRIRMNEIERLIVLLLIQKEKLEEKEEVDPSKGFIHKNFVSYKTA